MEGTRIYKNFHQWLIPSRAVVVILALASVFVIVGIVLLVIGRYIHMFSYFVCSWFLSDIFFYESKFIILSSFYNHLNVD